MGKDRKKEHDRPPRGGGDDPSSQGREGPTPGGGGPASPGGEEGVDDLIRSRPELEREIRMILDWIDGEKVAAGEEAAGRTEQAGPRDESVGEAGTTDPGTASGSPPSEGGRGAAAAARGVDGGLEGVPRILGDFRIVRLIGSGGVGAVYEAEQISLQRRVALKVLFPRFGLMGEAVLQFRQEARAGGRQNHPGIVTIHAVGEQGGLHYIAEEYVEGGFSLADKLEAIRKTGDPPVGYFREAARFLAAAADALQHAHNSGVVHGDIKPSNILITGEGAPKVSDFGLARIRDALVLSKHAHRGGTPFYMSPEQASGRKIDNRSDVFSLGAAFYEMLALKRPFEGEDPGKVLAEVRRCEPPDLRRLSPRIPRDLAVICRKAIEKNPERRYASMAELAGDLRRFLEGEPIEARPAGWPRRAAGFLCRHRAALFAALFLLAASVSLAVLFLALSRERQKERRLIEALYVPVKEVLGWSDPTQGEMPWFWCQSADPSSPSGPMLLALYSIEMLRLTNAEVALEECLALISAHPCPNRPSCLLAPDVRFLLGAVRLARASREVLSPKVRSALVAKGRENLAASTASGLEEGKTLVWRGGLSFASGPREAEKLLENLRLNNGHCMVRLARGVSLFTFLFQGGRRDDYERAIRSFESILSDRPGDVIASGFLGRILFFYGRAWGDFSLFDRARELSKRAVALSGGKPYHLFLTTLGQIELFFGRDDKALEWFEAALKAAPPKARHIHNAWCGVGRVRARQGRFGEALENFQHALSLARDDMNVEVDMAELYLARGNGEAALKCAREASDRIVFLAGSRRVVQDTCFAPAYLARIRALLLLKRYADAENVLWEMEERAIDSPRHESLACMLAATFPGRILGDEKTGKSLRVVASRLVLWNLSTPPVVPIFLSGFGARDYLAGRYEEAIGHLKSAVALRKKWPEDLRAFQWPEDARDYYLLAMACGKLARKEPGRASAAEKEARAWFEKAESLFKSRKHPFEEADITQRIRDKAREVLSGPIHKYDDL